MYGEFLNSRAASHHSVCRMLRCTIEPHPSRAMSFFKTREEEVAFLKGLQKHPFFEPLVALMSTHSDAQVHELCRIHPVLLTGEMDWFLDYWAINLNKNEEHIRVLDERRQVIERLRNAQQPSKPRPDVIAEVPFTPFRSRVKCIRTQDWTELQTAAFKSAFPAFFATEKPNPRWVTQRDPFGTATGSPETPYRYRRYSGGTTLPRNRYYSICEDATGADSQTLAREIMTYCERTSSQAFALDLDDPVESGPWPFFENSWGVRCPTNQIALVFEWKTSSPPPDFAFIPRALLATGARMFPVFIPTTLLDVSISRAIDLRLPRTQEWLVAHLLNALPSVAYTADGVLYRGLPLGDGHDIPWPIESRFTTRDGLDAFSYPPSPNREHASGSLSADFLGILEFLMFPTRGGSPLTEAIGRWLRFLGAEALIYPSARADVECVIEDGALKRWRGWNLVDYRGLDPIEERAMIIHEPNTWRGGWTGIHVTKGGGRLVGSFLVEGNVRSHLPIVAAHLRSAGDGQVDE